MEVNNEQLFPEVEVNSEQLFPEVEVNSEQLFTEVEMNRPEYSPSCECGEVNILGFSLTLR